MLIQGQVGQPSVSSIAAGANPTVRQGQLGDVIVSGLHGRYYETTYRRNMYSAVLTAGTTTSAGLATGFTGLLLYNPQNSTVNVAVNKVGLAFIVAFATNGSGIGLQMGSTATALLTSPVTTNVTIRPTFGGLPNNSGQAVAYSSATVVAGNVSHVLSAGLTGAITTVTAAPGFYDLEGSVVLPPGTWLGTWTSTASGTNALLASFQYEEIPL